MLSLYSFYLKILHDYCFQKNQSFKKIKTNLYHNRLNKKLSLRMMLKYGFEYFRIALIFYWFIMMNCNLQQPVLDNSNKSNKNGEKSFESVIKSVPSEVIKSMLLSEVNSFQKDFFELLQKCKSINIEVYYLFCKYKIFIYYIFN